jgi:BlaI family penicillinase repressor
MVYRLLEGKGAVRIVRRIGNANIFTAAISREDAGRRLMDELLALFGGRTKPVMAHLVESGKLTLEDVKEAEQAIRKLAKDHEVIRVQKGSKSAAKERR